MAIVAEISWDDMMAGKPLVGDPVRQVWDQALSEAMSSAYTAWPESHERIRRAMQIVMQGDVEVFADGSARVASQSNGEQSYRITAEACPCKDFVRAPKHMCKHRIAQVIQRRATLTARAALKKLDTPRNGVESAEDTPEATLPDAKVNLGTPSGVPLPAICPEALFSLNLKIRLGGRDGQLTVRGQSVEEFTRNVQVVRELFDTDDEERTAAIAANPAPTSHWCAQHGELRQSTKAPGTYFCPGKLADGSYCKAHWPETKT